MTLLPATLPFWFGLSGVRDPVGGLVYFGDYAERGVNRLLKQFHGRPRLEEVLRIWLEEAQAIEDTFWNILYMRDLAGAFGVHLDVIGKIVGVARGGLNDDSYRLLLRAQIRSLRSRGRPEDLITVSQLVFLSEDFEYEDDIGDPAAAAIDARGIALPFDPMLTRNIFRRTKAAGVRLYVYTTTAPLPETFRFATGDTVETGDSGFADYNDPSAPAGAFASVYIA